MKKNNYNPNSIPTIVNFGSTVYNENGKAVFVTKATADLEPDNVAEWEARWNHIYRKPIANPMLIVSGRKLNLSKPWD